MKFEKNNVVKGTYDHDEYVVLKLLIKKQVTGSWKFCAEGSFPISIPAPKFVRIL